MNYTLENVHIDLIRPTDTVEHDGNVMTVGKKDLTNITGMGRALFGDTYHLGHKPVSRVKFTQPR